MNKDYEDTRVAKDTGKLKKVAFAGIVGALVGAVILAVSLDMSSPEALPPEPQPKPVEKLLTLSGDGSVRNNSSSPDGIMSESSAAADMLWWNPIEYVYLPGASLSTEGGESFAYQLRLDREAPVLMSTLTDVWSVDSSTVKQNPYGFDEKFFIAGDWENGLAPSLSYHHSGAGNWNFSDPTAYFGDAVAVDCAVIGSDGGSERGEACIAAPEKRETPNNIPTEREALESAEAIFVDIYGISPVLTVSSHEWGVDVSGSFLVDGKYDAGLMVGISWYGDAIAYAYGVNVVSDKIENIPIVSPREAAERVSDYRWWGFDPLAVRDYPEIAWDAAVSAPEGSKTDPTVGGLIEDSPVRIEPEPAEEDFPVDVGVVPDEVEVEVREVELVGSAQRMLTVWTDDGSMWLLPGYTFDTSEPLEFGGAVSIVAVSAELVNLG